MESLGEFSCSSVTGLIGSDAEVFGGSGEGATVSLPESCGLRKFESKGYFWPVLDRGVEDVSFCRLANRNSPLLCLGMGIGLDTGPLAGDISSFEVSWVSCFLMLAFS